MSNTLANCGNPVMAALAIGLSCGAACSPLVNLFLSTYPLGRFNSIKKSWLAFGYFWLGKTAVVIGLVSLSAMLGKAIIGQDGLIFGFDSKLVLDFCMILTGVILLAGMFLKRRKGLGCSNCGVSDHESENPIRPAGIMPLVIMGVAYGLTPCAPLLTVLLLAVMMTPVQAMMLGLVFSVASSIAPLLILSTLAGIISQKMQREIPQQMQIIQITSCWLFIILGGISLFKHL